MDQKNSVFVISIIFVFLARSAHGQTTTVAAESSTVSAEVSSSSAEASSSSVSSSVADSFSPSVGKSAIKSKTAESSTVSAEVSSSSAEASSSSVSSLVADSFSSSVATSSQTSSSIEASSTSTAAVTSSSSASIESPSTSASLTTTSSSAFSASSASTTPTASLSQTPTTTSSVGSGGESSVSSSISPSTTTTTTTSTASSDRNKPEIKIRFICAILTTFINDMLNTSSAAYNNTCESVLNAIKTAINDKVGSVIMESCNLKQGSVIANFTSALEDIKFTSDGSDPLVAIQNAVQAITRVGGFSANVSGVEIKFGSDTTVTAFNITKTDFKTDCCKSDFQYTNLTRECYVTKDGQKSPCSNFQTYKTVPCDMKKTHDAYKIGEPVPSDFFDQLCISGSLCVQASMLTLALGFFISKNFY